MAPMEGVGCVVGLAVGRQGVTKTEKAIIKAAYAWERKTLIEVFDHGPAYRLMKAVLADKRAKKEAKK
jgi:hypothetical protein